MSTPPLTVAVTGPTGEIGKTFIRALEQAEGVGEIRGMARRPFDPASMGWQRTTYVQGDILDRGAVDDLVAGADVVVHLAFIIFGNVKETRSTNLEGSRNVFAAAGAAGAARLVYTSSVAAYGFHGDNPLPLSEDVPPARQREPLLLRTEGRARGRALRGAGRYDDGRVHLPTLHRGRAGVAHPHRAAALREGVRSTAWAGAAAGRRPAHSRAGAPRLRGAPPARPRRGRRAGPGRGGPRPGRAGDLQPRGSG